MDAASPLACLLIGQPTLRRMLRLGVLAALDQRIALRYAMPAMTRRADRRLHHPPPAARRPVRHPVQRRRHAPSSTTPPAACPGPSTTSPPRPWSPPWPPRKNHRRRAVRPRRRHRDHGRLTTTTPPRTPRPRRHQPAGPSCTRTSSPPVTPHILILNDRAHQGPVGSPCGIASTRWMRPACFGGAAPRSGRGSGWRAAVAGAGAVVAHARQVVQERADRGGVEVGQRARRRGPCRAGRKSVAAARSPGSR